MGERNWGRQALAFASAGIVGVAGCSFLLDTDKLQGGPALVPQQDPTDGAVGQPDASSPPGDGSIVVDAAGGDASQRACVSSLECEDDNDLCTLDECDTEKRACKARVSWSGHPKISPIGSAAIPFTADDIALPTIAADASDIYVAAWYKTKDATDVRLIRYDVQAPAVLPVQYELSDLNVKASIKGVSGFRSSPGMLMTPLPTRRLELAVAADPKGDGQVGVYRETLDPSSPIKVVTQPIPVAVSTRDYAADGMRVTPRMFRTRTGVAPTSSMTVAVMWPQAGKLMFHDGTGSTAPLRIIDVPGKQVVNAVPVPGESLSVFGAALELGSQTEGETKLWSSGREELLHSLSSVETVGPRYGISTTQIEEGSFASRPLSLIFWSYGKEKGHQIDSVAASCDKECKTVALAPQGSSIDTGALPAVASARAVSLTERNLALAFTVTNAQSLDQEQVTHVLVMWAAKVKNGDLSTLELASPTFNVLETVTVPAQVPLGRVIGQPVVAVTPNGQVMVAWVLRDLKTQQASLHTKRYAISNCP